MESDTQGQVASEEAKAHAEREDENGKVPAKVESGPGNKKGPGISDNEGQLRGSQDMLMQLGIIDADDMIKAAAKPTPASYPATVEGTHSDSNIACKTAPRVSQTGAYRYAAQNPGETQCPNEKQRKQAPRRLTAFEHMMQSHRSIACNEIDVDELILGVGVEAEEPVHDNDDVLKKTTLSRNTNTRASELGIPGAHALPGPGLDVQRAGPGLDEAGPDLEQQRAERHADSKPSAATFSPDTSTSSEGDYTDNPSDSRGLVEAQPVLGNSQWSIYGRAEPVHESGTKDSQQQKTKATFTAVVSIGGLIIFILLVIVLSVGLSIRKNDDNSSDTIPTTTAPTEAPIIFAIDGLPDYTQQVLIQNTRQGTTSPQSRAYDWVLQDPNLPTYSPERILQRYALATFYYSTNGDAWTQGAASNSTLPPGYQSSGVPPRPPSKPRPIPGMVLPPRPPPTGNVTDSKTPWLDYGIDECLWFNRNIERQLETCTWEGQYKNLNMDLNNLEGTLPPELSLLTELSAIVLRRNFIQGSLPPQLFAGLAGGMERFDIESNFFTGTIPTEIGLWTKLGGLRIQRNAFTGTVPSELLLLTSLNEIMAGLNDLSGTIPTGVGTAFPFMVKLEFYGGQMTGSIPSEIGLMTELRVLELSGNILTSTIPTELGLLHKLFSLQLQSNNLTGSLPSELGQLQALEVLTLGDNLRLSGTIPDELGVLAVSLAYLLPEELQQPPPSGLGLDPAGPSTGSPPGSPPGPPPPVPMLSPLQLSQLISLEVFEFQGTNISGILPSEFCNSSMETLLFDCSSALCGCDCDCTENHSG